MSLRPKMMRLANNVESLIPAYFTENPVNIDDWWGYKYFLCFENTHKVICACKSQADMIEALQDIIEVGGVWDGNYFFGKPTEPYFYTN